MVSDQGGQMNMKKKATILIIEDEEVFRVVFGGVLKDKGYIIHEATDGKMGIEKVKSLVPDLILLDLVLPVLDGFEVLEQIRADLSINKIPIVVLSVLGEKDKMKKAFELGADDYLIKGEKSPKSILEKIEAILSK